MTTKLFGAGLFNEDLFNGIAFGGDLLRHAVYFNTTEIQLKWNAVEGADLYQVQVNVNPDFTGDDILLDQTADTNIDFTDAGVNDAKRYWRWRWSQDGGASYSDWMGLGSYWLNTSAPEDVDVALNRMMVINPEDVTDRHYLLTFPFLNIQFQVLERLRTRNRLGTLLSEYITVKAMLTFSYGDMKFMRPQDQRLMRRFNEEVKTFFVAGFWEQEPGNPIPNIWQVQLAEDPVFVGAVAGRLDILEGEMKFTEV